MSASVKVEGLLELRQHLATLPEQVRDRARAIVREATEGCRSDVQREYAVGPTGNLRSRVYASYERDGMKGRVKSMAPHAHWYERGTKVRTTKKTSANRGRMPKNAVMPSAAYRRRFIMRGQLITMMRNLGFTVNA